MIALNYGPRFHGGRPQHVGLIQRSWKECILSAVCDLLRPDPGARWSDGLIPPTSNHAPGRTNLVAVSVHPAPPRSPPSARSGIPLSEANHSMAFTAIIEAVGLCPTNNLATNTFSVDR
jgi:hypothetical protein